jgi:hypothetical protein
MVLNSKGGAGSLEETRSARLGCRQAESGFEFPIEGGGPGRAEKNFYLYVRREVKETVEDFSETLGDFKGLSSIVK